MGKDRIILKLPTTFVLLKIIQMGTKQRSTVVLLHEKTGVKSFGVTYLTFCIMFNIIVIECLGLDKNQTRHDPNGYGIPISAKKLFVDAQLPD